jgi:hypothetical protein
LIGLFGFDDFTLGGNAVIRHKVPGVSFVTFWRLFDALYSFQLVTFVTLVFRHFEKFSDGVKWVFEKVENC